MDVTEFLFNNLKLNYVKNEKKYKIAYHSACSMQHGQKVHNQPIELLKKTGNIIVEIPEGISAVAQPEHTILFIKILQKNY